MSAVGAGHANGTGAGLTGPEIAAVAGGRLLHAAGRPVRGAVVDSRLVSPGNLFVALRGERTDGHRFVRAAAAAGAAAVLVSESPPEPFDDLDVSVVLVPDTLAALQAIARSWRARFDPLVVGVTGSIAKTSTKEAVAAVLARRLVTLRSPGNQNNEIGLPLTLLALGPEHEAIVLEMGMYQGGEVALLAEIARPRIGVVTAVREVHLSRVGTLDAVENAKAELVEALPAEGTAVLNADDPRTSRMDARTSSHVLRYGFSEAADVRAEDLESKGALGMRFTLVMAGLRRRLDTPVLGRHGVHNALAAAAVGRAAGLADDAIAEGIAAGWKAAHRTELRPAGDVTILDDSYNAAPLSVAAALEVLVGLPGRPVAVLGEMLELGSATDAAHLEVGRMTATRVELLVVVGEGASGIARGAREAGLHPERIVEVADRPAALDALRRRLRPGDAVLVKGSRGAALDELVDALVAERAGRVPA